MAVVEGVGVGMAVGLDAGVIVVVVGSVDPVRVQDRVEVTLNLVEPANQLDVVLLTTIQGDP